MDVSAFFLLILFAGVFAAILSGIPAMFAIGGVPFLVALCAALFGAFDLSFLNAFPQRLFGLMSNSLFIAIPLFVFMGLLLERAGIAKRMLEGAGALAGGGRRALSLAVLGMSGLLAATTGIIGATVVMLGVLSYPALQRSGVPERLASGMVLAAGSLGQIIPPSIALIILADQISNAHLEAGRLSGDFAVEPVTVSDLFAAALLPGLLLVVLYALYMLIRLPAEKGRSAMPASPQLVRRFSKTGYDTVFLPLILIIAVLGSILFGLATATEAAALGVAGALLLCGRSAGRADRGLGRGNRPVRRFAVLGLVAGAALFVLRSATHPLALLIVFVALGILAAGLLVSAYYAARKGILQAVLGETILISGMIFGIVIAASMLSLVFRGLGGDVLIRDIAAALPGEKWTALALFMLLIFLLGFMLEFVEIIFITIPIAGPVLLAMDIPPLWLAVLIALNLQTSFLTPPFGLALFYFRSVAPATLTTPEIYRSVVPFVILQLMALVLVALFPQLALMLPEYLFG